MLEFKRISIIIVFVFQSVIGLAQDPELSQYYNSPLYTNPAFAGLSGGNRFVMNYRDQWSGAFKSYGASFDASLPRMKSGLGVLVFSDDAGAIQTNSAFLSYAYNTKVNYDWTISFGMQGGLKQSSVDWSKMIFADAINSNTGAIGTSAEKTPANASVLYPDFHVGGLAYSDYAFGGLAIHNINAPNMSFTGYNGNGSFLPRKVTIHGGIVLKPNPKIKDLVISPNLLAMFQGGFTQINFGFYINKSSFLTGLWYRQTGHNSDALIAMFGLRSKNLKFSYSYDFTISGQKYANPGSHEISLIWVFYKGERSSREYGKLSCYGFR